MGRYQKIKIYIEKGRVLHIEFKNIEVEYKLSNREIKKKTNEECDFDDAFKADNHILSIVLRANERIGWMVRNFISSEVNIVLKIYKILIRSQMEYSAQTRASSVET